MISHVIVTRLDASWMFDLQFTLSATATLVKTPTLDTKQHTTTSGITHYRNNVPSRSAIPCGEEYVATTPGIPEH